MISRTVWILPWTAVLLIGQWIPPSGVGGAAPAAGAPVFQAASQPRQLLWVTRLGEEEKIGVPPAAFLHPSLSPEGKRLAVTIRGQGTSAVWIYDLSAGDKKQLTSESALHESPVWSPDGRMLAYSSTLTGGAFNLFMQPAAGGQAKRLTQKPELTQSPAAWTGSGQILFHELNPATFWDLALIVPESGQISPLLNSPFSELRADISADGRWMVYQSDESGRMEVYVRPFPAVDNGKWQISRGGGSSPLWSPDGREVFYRSSDSVMRAAVQTEGAFSSQGPEVLFSGNFFVGPARQYDVAPDGRFLMMRAETGN